MNPNFEPVTVKSFLAGSTRRPGAAALVVVGIDDRPLDAFRQAAVFATAEATRRRAGILLVHGCEPLTGAPVVEAIIPLEEREKRGREVVAAAAEIVAQHLPDDWPVQVCVEPGTGAQALNELSAVAAVIVLQRRRVSAIRRWQTGSTTSRVAARANCPTVVVREDHDAAGQDSPVVVGVDDRGHAGNAVDVAFAEADLRRSELIAVHAWQPPDLSSGFIPPDPDELAELRQSAQAELAEALAGHSQGFPDVAVQCRVLGSPVIDALVQASQGAGLLILGRHGNQRVGTVALGSVARQCMKVAPCPVMITPVGRTDRRPSRWLSMEAPVGFGY
jgi:nucleotide-binding universal stress UspA family protein